MAKTRGNRRETVRTTGFVALVAFVVVIICFVVWTQAVMQGTRAAALAVWENDAVQIEEVDGSIVMRPTDAAAEPASGDGLVFIPGAKVDPYAYLGVLAGAVEDDGLTVVITKPTLNLAFFDTRPLSAFTGAAPGVDRWYVGGHSLGGVRACQLADDPAVSGLVLFGSYCANDLSGSDLAVLSVSGTDDGLSTPEKIADARYLLPSDASFVELDGANHASFGDYGVQPGDGTATIDHAEAHREITRALGAFLR